MNIRVACKQCGFFNLCRMAGLEEGDFDLLDKIILRCQPVSPRSSLIKSGDQCSALYAVKFGSFKTYKKTTNGENQLVGFHLPGELIGLEAIKSGQHEYAAESLEDSGVCKLSFDNLQHFGKRLPAFHERLVGIMSDQLQLVQEQIMMTGQQAAERRLASFLYNLFQRYSRLGLPARRFRLSMLRHDIANYLGLSVETVSRLFSRYQKLGILTVQGKKIHLLEPTRLMILGVQEI